MLAKSTAKSYFLWTTGLFTVVFLGLSVDTFQKIPAQTHAENITPQVARGKELWEQNNCMGCHTLLGEGAYYAPELTKVYERRGAEFIKWMLKDPEKLFPNQRKMVAYHMPDEDAEALVAFFKWIGAMDLNGFPPTPGLNHDHQVNTHSEASFLNSVTPQPANHDHSAHGASSSASGAPGAQMPPSHEHGGTPMAAQVHTPPEVFETLCKSCHSLGGQGGKVGPALDGVGLRMNKTQLDTWLKDPSAVRPGTAMPKLPLSENQREALAEFLAVQNK